MPDNITDRTFPRELAGLNEAMRRIRPGSRVELIVGLKSEISRGELDTIGRRLAEGGLKLIGPVTLGSTPEWPSAIKIDFVTPDRKSIAFLPILPIIGIVGALGALGVAGWGVTKVTESFAKNLVPITLIIVGGLVFYGYTTRKKSIA